jgi:hypothetical protein
VGEIVKERACFSKDRDKIPNVHEPCMEQGRALRKRNYTDTELRATFDSCWLKRCVQVLDGRLSICPRLSSGRALNIVDDDYDERIDLADLDEEVLRKNLINFYKKVFLSHAVGV